MDWPAKWWCYSHIGNCGVLRKSYQPLYSFYHKKIHLDSSLIIISWRIVVYLSCLVAGSSWTSNKKGCFGEEQQLKIQDPGCGVWWSILPPLPRDPSHKESHKILHVRSAMHTPGQGNLLGTFRSWPGKEVLSQAPRGAVGTRVPLRVWLVSWGGVRP